MTEGLQQITLTVEDAARVLGIPKRSIYEHAERNLLPHIRLGRRILILKTGIDQLVETAMSGAPVKAEAAN